MGRSAGEIAQLLDWSTATVHVMHERARAGGMLSVAEIQRAYQEHAGKAAARSTVYRLLERRGWRKIVSRPPAPESRCGGTGRL